MNIETLREYCLTLKGATESFPFDDTTLVFKVGGKIFAMANLDGPLSVNIKCNPDEAVEIREQYPAVTPGYHMNKKHWNTVMIDGTIPLKTILQWVFNSYSLVFQALTRSSREKIANGNIN